MDSPAAPSAAENEGNQRRVFGPQTASDWRSEQTDLLVTFYRRMADGVDNDVDYINVELLADSIADLHKRIARYTADHATLEHHLAISYDSLRIYMACIGMLRDELDRQRCDYEAFALPLQAALSSYRTRDHGLGQVNLPYPLPLARDGPPLVPMVQQLTVWEGEEWRENEGFVPTLWVTFGEPGGPDEEQRPLAELEKTLAARESQMAATQRQIDEVRRVAGTYRRKAIEGIKKMIAVNLQQRANTSKVVEAMQDCLDVAVERQAALKEEQEEEALAASLW